MELKPREVKIRVKGAARNDAKLAKAICQKYHHTSVGILDSELIASSRIEKFLDGLARFFRFSDPKACVFKYKVRYVTPNPTLIVGSNYRRISKCSF